LFRETEVIASRFLWAAFEDGGGYFRQ